MSHSCFPLALTWTQGNKRSISRVANMSHCQVYQCTNLGNYPFHLTAVLQSHGPRNFILSDSAIMLEASKNFHITTPRLHLSYLDADNDGMMAFIVRHNSSPESIAVKAQSGVKSARHPENTEAARASYKAASERLEKTGSGRYIISLRKAGVGFTEEQGDREYIGIVSMQLRRFSDRDCPLIPDLGFGLYRDYYGKGYATEACEAMMKYFKEEKGHERFAGFTHPENVNSQKLFRRLGFKSRGTMDIAGVIPDGTYKIAVWTKNVSPETKLSDLNIGPKAAEEAVVSQVQEAAGV